jgi:hypothetical protein
VGLLATFCGSAAAQRLGVSARQQLISLDINNHSQHIEAIIGEEIDVTLGTIGPGNYGAPEISSAAIQYDNVELVWPPTPGGPTQIFVFHAAGQGTAEIRIAHVNSGPFARPTFVVTITVRPDARVKPDQETTSPWTNAWANLVNDARQTFTPSFPHLTAVEVELTVANPDETNGEVTLALLDDAGTVLRHVSKTVAANDCGHVRFVFAKGGVDVSPGKSYTIHLGSNSMLFGWKYVLDGYKGGSAWFNNKAVAGGRGEFLFRTYGMK